MASVNLPRPLPTRLTHIHHGLIVSCQAAPDEPLHGSAYMAAMARAAAEGGAVAIRANGPTDIVAIRAAVSLPIIGLYKIDLPGFEVRITPTVSAALELAEAGADVIAVDATNRPRPENLSVAEMIKRVREATGLPVLADISTLEEGLAAAEAGADLVATTLSGYTAYSPQQDEPDFALIQQLAPALERDRIALIAEGRIHTPEQAARALACGAFAVVVGTAITRPQEITKRFVTALTNRN